MKFCKLMISFSLVVFGVLSSLFITATQQNISVQASQSTTPPPAAINEIFPDPGLAQEIQKILNKNSVSDQVTQAELSSIKYVYASSNKIENITGMEYLIHLTRLNLMNNQISDISPLASLEDLEYIHLDNNKITNVEPLANKKKALEIMVSDNQITDISSLLTLTMNSEVADSIIVYADDQTITKQIIPWSVDIDVVNSIVDTDGNIVSPNKISNSGSYVGQTINWNQLPTDLEEVSYNFSYIQQYVNNNGFTTYVRFSGKVVQPITQTKEMYTVTFIDQSVIYNSAAVSTDDLITQPISPTKDGYTFVGWNTVADGSGINWNFTENTMPANDITLYAQYTLNPITQPTESNTTTNNPIVLPTTGEKTSELLLFGLGMLFSASVIILSKKRMN
ncbi:internalin N-terminal domain-containing protein [Culicoidibacter larvae]|uniref:LPXTG cell wall anchor domain-containing protein n=1 Tax=Culicoidibacter larvae TaxID=2579976 RepID=A0A5R8QCS7_9FIRM|nr:InlB B-repeat-containing protein [Culicoidibacter larvae]TLG74318.1 LPXTG cell wall anchor domain-containing protein [Culicoidibacter larvae]